MKILLIENLALLLILMIILINMLFSLDKENKSQKGIIHLNAIDFLLSEDF